MNQFVTPLRAEKAGYDSAGRPVWEMLGPLVYLSDRFGEVVVPPGFLTNFCSVPRIPVAYWLAGDRAHEQGALHDFEYTVRRRSREEADALFLEALGARTVLPPEMDSHVPGWLAWAMYQAVRIGGQSSWDADTLVPQPQNIAQTIAAP